MEEVEAGSRLAEIAQLPLDRRADLIDGLIDELESALEDTSPTESDSES